MPEADVGCVRLAMDPPVRARFYRSLAWSLSATRGPAGAVIEGSSEDPAPWVTFRPRSLVATVRASPVPGASEIRSGAAPLAELPTATPERYGVLVPATVPATGARVPAGSADRPDLSVALRRARLALQTFWVREPDGRIAVARRFRVEGGPGSTGDAFDLVAPLLALDWSDRLGVPVVPEPAPGRPRSAWRQGSPRGLRPAAWRRVEVPFAARTAEGPTWGPTTPPPPAGHAVLWGASGAGKTSLLARWAAESIGRGVPVLAIDLHGDLVPAIVAQLPPGRLRDVVAVDAECRPVAGISALPPADGDGERAAAHLVAALKRLTPDGTDLYWGFRLERIFDTLVRVVQEQRGSLLDLYALLTDPDRRDAARLALRRTDLARFLDELAPVVRRNPEFLWSAATRLSKIVLVPALGELLAPSDGGLPVEELLTEGRSILLRLPFATLGPEAAQLAGSLVLGRLYLGLAARRRGETDPRAVRLVLDEVQGFSPRLVAEILTESRKFGFRVLLASQYPDRLAPELRAAAAGTLTGCVTFRVPRASAREVGAWFGLSPAESEATLPELPVGQAIAVGLDGEGLRTIASAPVTPIGSARWAERVSATRDEFEVDGSGSDPGERPDDALLLAVLQAEESGAPLTFADLVPAARAFPGADRDPALVEERARRLVDRGDLRVTEGRCRLSDSGARLLGLGAPTGATRETPRHRALLLRAFRVFARHGARLEIVRQGRFDTTLPDAVFHLLADATRRAPAPELRLALERLRTGWAWRCFGGRDVHVEAEVSGARRAVRLRHDWAKARARDAFLVVAIDNAADAHRAREILRAIGAGPDRAQVWHLGPPRVPEPKP